MGGLRAAVVQQVGDEFGAGTLREAQGGQGRTAAGEGQQLGGLVAFEVDHLQPVPRLQGHHREAAGGDAVAFQARGAGEQGRLQRPGYHGQVHVMAPRKDSLVIDQPAAFIEGSGLSAR
ncbi:hypothetical protein D3C80_1841680 [compost metagenome]